MKISPTPWKLDYADGYFILDAEGNGVVESITPCADEQVTHNNGVMLTAAPKLLAALKELCDAMHPHVMKMGIKKGFHEHAVLAEARAMILEAENM